ncbi:MAG: PHP domain-containing protein [Deltaproteobacteria bacterium]|nr:PHP domain-containing protein [Deltaproteobacteria bacterium]
MDAPAVADAAPAADVAAKPDGQQGCAPGPVAAGAVRARPLACADDLPQGRMAAARAGDLVLENARARFVVRTGPHGHAMAGLLGGNVVDAVALDSKGVQIGVDALHEWIAGAGFFLLSPDHVEVTHDGSGADAEGPVAIVRVRGKLAPFPVVAAALPLDPPAATVQHEYLLRPDSTRLEIRTTVVPTSKQAETILVADIGLWSGSLELYRPGKGDGHNDLPPPAQLHTVGMAPVDRDPLAVPCAAGFAGGVSSFDAGSILAFVQTDTKVPAEGKAFRRFLVVGGDGGPDLAAAMATAGEAAGLSFGKLKGTVAGMRPGVEVELLGPKAAPLTRCRPAPTGAYQCRVPVTAVAARAIWIGNGNGQGGGGGQTQDAAGTAFSVAAGAEATLDLQAPAAAILQVQVKDTGGAGLPFQLIAQPQGAIAKVGGRTFVDADGEASFELPPGTWKAWVHHGPEFAVHEAEVAVVAGQTAKLAATLQRVLHTEGWIAGDFHIHAEHSVDSSVPNRQRLVDAAAAGIEYAVATDHDFVTDYAPFVQEAGLQGRLTVASGVEVSTVALGHHNIWPLAVQPDQPGNGAPAWFGKEPKALQTLLRGGDAKRVVQVNHPRGSQSYFEGIDLGPQTDVALLAFDAMELLNGKRMQDTEQVLADWFALLARGLSVTATANSDTHSLSSGAGGVRTWIWVGRDAAGKGLDEQGKFTAAQADEALRRGKAVASAGPLLEIELDAGGAKAGIGEALITAKTDMTVRARLQAPAWMPLGTLEIYRDGALVHKAEVTSTAVVDGRRLAVVEVPAKPKTSGWWVAVHRPKGKGTNPAVAQQPWATTNPVYEGVVPD